MAQDSHAPKEMMLGMTHDGANVNGSKNQSKNTPALIPIKLPQLAKGPGCCFIPSATPLRGIEKSLVDPGAPILPHHFSHTSDPFDFADPFKFLLGPSLFVWAKIRRMPRPPFHFKSLRVSSMVLKRQTPRPAFVLDRT